MTRGREELEGSPARDDQRSEHEYERAIELLRRSRTEPAEDFDIWVLVHPDLRANPRLRLFRDEMVDALVSIEDALRGS